MTRAIDLIMSRHWAITQDAMKNMQRIALRKNEDWEVLAGKIGAPLQYTYETTIRAGVAIIPINGPVFPKANLMTQMSGATSLELVSHDLAEAIDNTAVKAIVLQIDSPGGVAFGPSELADELRAASKVKPVIAYVSGMACSAAYWIACGCSEIVAHKSAILGSIGVVTSIPKQEEPDSNGDMYYEIVSSNAQNKRPDPSTDGGMAEIVRELNDIETQFISSVAEFRGVTTEKVIKEFGGGGVLIAADAVRVGMADRTGDFESLLKELSTGSLAAARGNVNATQQETKTMSLTAEKVKAENKDVADALIKEGRDAGYAEGVKAGVDQGAKAERERLAGIDEAAKPGHEDIVASAKADGKSTAADVALAINRAEKKTGANHLEGLKAAEKSLPTVDPSASNKLAGGPKAEEEDETLPIEERAKKTWDADKDLRAEFKTFDAYLGFRKGEEAGAIRSKSK